jgi:hypothetical protein
LTSWYVILMVCLHMVRHFDNPAPNSQPAILKIHPLTTERVSFCIVVVNVLAVLFLHIDTKYFWTAPFYCLSIKCGYM